MEPMTMEEMRCMQEALQAKHKGDWAALTPQQGHSSLLWMLGEAGEVAQIIKKKGDARIMTDEVVRADFVEEMADVLMYFNDVLLCYDITPQEFAAAYRGKYEHNMRRDWHKEHREQEEARRAAMAEKK
ncbi:MAG: MazG nucleotide pyrophosphohydrolase domain-containing protein [Eubacteriales bacterium]|nr:MazG nucleotide pyrophosphohydrolase domain-containing protein [Eubacteriales bacterium]